jgi:hypothetical protein
MDCSANPNDQVCIAYYGTTPSGGGSPFTMGANRVAAAVRSGEIVGKFQVNQSNPQGAATAGANVIITPTQGASPIAASAGGLFNLLTAIPWWVKLGAVLGGGYLAYTKWYKPKAG